MGKPADKKVTVRSKKHKCTVAGCTKRFKRINQLDRHVLTHSGKVKCPNCGVEVCNQSVLKYTHNCEVEIGRRVADKIYSKSTTDAKSPSRIATEYEGIIDLKVGVAKDFENYVSITNEEWKIPKAVFESVRITEIDGTLPIYVANRNKSFTPSIVHILANFHQDSNINAADQAGDDDFNRSGYYKLHLASAANYCTSEAAVRNTYCYSNCAPGTARLNTGQMKNLEDLGRLLVRTYRKVHIITIPLFVFSPVNTLKAEGKVGIPDLFGKIFIYRDEKGLQIEGWKTIVSDDFAAQPTQCDPFDLAKEAALSFLVDQRYFAFINNEANNDHEEGLDNNLLPRNI